jgi:hypothetical protein
MTEGSNCPGASDLIGLGATVLAEEAPHPQHHRQLIFYHIVLTAGHIHVNSNLGVNALQGQKEGIHHP